MSKASKKYIVRILKRKLEEATGKKVRLKEGLPDFLTYDNLFASQPGVAEPGIAKPKIKPGVAPAPSTKPKSPLSPSQPVVKPRPKA